MRIEELMQDGIELIETEKGSQYHYLRDGRTQRFKKIEGKWYEPQDVLVFVPTRNYLMVRDLSKSLKVPGHSEVEYVDTLRAYLGLKHSMKHINIVNPQGSIIRNRHQLSEAASVFALFSTDYKVDFYIPVAKNPRLGFYPFDRKYYTVGNG